VGVIQSYADARLVSRGRISLTFGTTPLDARPVEVKNGRFVYGQAPDDGYRGPLTLVPSGGSNLVGDRVVNAAPAKGGCMGWVCVADGNPGIWERYAMIST
jgi:hypothetical protein